MSFWDDFWDDEKYVFEGMVISGFVYGAAILCILCIIAVIMGWK